mgnify:FL=1
MIIIADPLLNRSDTDSGIINMIFSRSRAIEDMYFLFEINEQFFAKFKTIQAVLDEDTRIRSLSLFSDDNFMNKFL